jgi:ribosome-binding factor A
MKQPSQRQLRVAEQIRFVISDALRRGHFKEPILINHASDIIVGGVDAAPDLKSAKIHVMNINGVDLTAILSALNTNRHYFQKEINTQLNIKFTPKVHFIEDASFAEAQRIESLLNSIK